MYLKIKNEYQKNANKLIANFIINEVMALCKRENITIEEYTAKVSPAQLYELLQLTFPHRWFDCSKERI